MKNRYTFAQFLIILFFSASLHSQDIWVGIHTGFTSETSMTLENGKIVFRPTSAESKLLVSDLNNALATNDVVIKTEEGDIRFETGTFSQEATNNTLFLQSEGNTTFSNIQNATDPLLLDICTGGDLIINGPGAHTNGEDFVVNVGGEISIQGGEIDTDGGNITLNAQGDILCFGRGILSEGGDIYLQGANLSTQEINSVDAGNMIYGEVVLNFTGDIIINGATLEAGDLSIYGNSFAVNFAVIRTNGTSPTVGGDMQIHVSEGITPSPAGLRVNGDFESTGSDVFLTGTGLQVSGGTIDMCHTGNIEIEGCGMTSTLTDNINRMGGDISIQTAGYVAVQFGGGVYTSPAKFVSTTMNSAGGGDVTVRADSIYLTDGSINTGMRSFDPDNVFTSGYNKGSGSLTVLPNRSTGKIFIENGAPPTDISYGPTIPSDNFLVLGPYLGDGNITLDVSTPAFCIPDPSPEFASAVECTIPTLPVPTLGQWSIIILSLLMVIIGILGIFSYTSTREKLS